MNNQFTHPKERIRFAILTFFFAQGLCMASWASRIPDFKDVFAANYAFYWGLILFMIPVGKFVAIPLAGYLVSKLGSRSMVQVSILGYASSLLCVGLAHEVYLLGFLLFCFGVFWNLCDISFNTQGIEVERLYGKTIMATFHGGWSLGACAGALIGFVMILAGVSPIWHYTLIFIIILIIALSGRKYLQESAPQEAEVSDTKTQERNTAKAPNGFRLLFQKPEMLLLQYLLATNKTYPSWGYMVEKGATTIWELWNGDTANPEMNSGNHVMLLGDLLPWCFNNLAGIRADRWKSGYKHIIFQPAFEIQELSNVDASYMSIYGKIISRWAKTPTHLEWDIELPANTTGEVHLPDGRKEKIGSGKYHFSVDIPTRNTAILSDEFLYKKTSFPECHGATIVELKNGDLVASFFGGTKERNPDCCIWVCRKLKGSKEWTAPKLAADGVFSLKDSQAVLAGIDSTCTPVKDEKGKLIARRKACWNPVLFQIPGGDLILFYKIGLKVSDWTGWLVRSRDGGKTWSKREPLPEGFLGPIKNKPEYINGRIICPSSTEGSNGWRVHFEISDDKGKTWKMVGPLDAELSVPTQNRKKGDMNVDDQEGGEAIKGEGAKPVYAIQPSILKHKDGRLQILCRTRNAQVATAWSSDNGDTWSKVTLLDVPNNNSGTDAVTMKDGRHILIYNNFSTLPGTPKGPRTPLCVAVSEDGINWQPVLTLEDSPISQYSYPSIIQGKDGKLHAIYTWRRQRIKYAEIDLTKF